MVNMDDLRSDGFVMLQKRLDPWWNLFWCFVAPALVAKHGWGERFLNAFMVAGALRYLCVLHFTWLVNSAAHLWGERPYDPASNPAENPLVSIAAMGEGWHNWVSSRALCQSHPCIAVPPPSPSPRVSPPPLPIPVLTSPCMYPVPPMMPRVCAAPQIPVRLRGIRVRCVAPIQPHEAGDRYMRGRGASLRPQASNWHVGP